MKRKALYLLLFAPFLALADLHVDASSNGVIHVWGSADVSEYFFVTNVCQNFLGSCTNCVQISPQQMRAYKTDILASCDDAYNQVDNIDLGLNDIANRSMYFIEDIRGFRRFGFQTSTSIKTLWPTFTNYIYGVDNAQTALCRSYSSNESINGRMQRVAYNDGIYDYANDYVLLAFESQYDQSVELIERVFSAKSSINSIRDTVEGMSEEACQGCGGGSGGGGGGDSSSCGDCPCAEQLDAIKDYVEHIDDDFHDQLFQMSVITNYVELMDSYARLVSGILYNDATIVVDNGENSWSNVYRRGYSDLYNYDKSNILQRIELLLYGLTPVSSTTNWGEIADIDSDALDVQSRIDGIGSTVSEGYEGLAENVTTIRGKISTLFDTLNFFGAHDLGSFTLNDPFQVFDAYELSSIEPAEIDTLDSFRTLFRSCFQIIYWVSGIAFMIAFWYFVVSFVINRIFGFLKFFNNLLT